MTRSLGKWKLQQIHAPVAHGLGRRSWCKWPRCGAHAVPGTTEAVRGAPRTSHRARGRKNSHAQTSALAGMRLENVVFDAVSQLRSARPRGGARAGTIHLRHRLSALGQGECDVCFVWAGNVCWSASAALFNCPSRPGTFEVSRVLGGRALDLCPLEDLPTGHQHSNSPTCWVRGDGDPVGLFVSVFGRRRRLMARRDCGTLGSTCSL